MNKAANRTENGKKCSASAEKRGEGYQSLITALRVCQVSFRLFNCFNASNRFKCKLIHSRQRRMVLRFLALFKKEVQKRSTERPSLWERMKENTRNSAPKT